MAESRIAELIIRAKAVGQKAVDGLADSLRKVRGQADKDIPDNTGKLRSGLNKTRGRVDELKQVLGGLAIGAAIQRGVSVALEATKRLENGLKGLAAVARFTGNDVSESFDAAAGLASDGLLTTAQAAKSLQNLLSRGYNLDEAISTLERLKDSAAFNRAAHLSLGEAVLTATEGLKNENSLLVDNAGVTKNVSVIWAEYAKQIGVGVKSLTLQQKIQAEVNGIMEETAAFSGNAQQALEGVQGAEARLNAESDRLAVLLGQALVPALTNIKTVGADLIQNFFIPIIAYVETLGPRIGGLADKIGAFWDALGSNNPLTVIENLRKLGDEFTRIDQVVEESVDSIYAKYTEELPGAAKIAADALGKVGDAAEQSTDGLNAAGEAGGKAADGLSKAGAAADASGGKLRTLSDIFGLVRDKITAVAGAITGNLSTALDLSTKRAEQLAQTLRETIESGGSLNAVVNQITALNDARVKSIEIGKLYVDDLQKQIVEMVANGASADALREKADELAEAKAQLAEAERNFKTITEQVNETLAAQRAEVEANTQATGDYIAQVDIAIERERTRSAENSAAAEAVSARVQRETIAISVFIDGWEQLTDAEREYWAQHNAQSVTGAGNIARMSEQQRAYVKEVQASNGALDALLERLRRGEVDTSELERTARTAEITFGRLGSERLEVLRAAISDARAEMEALNAAAAAALREQQDALDQATGNNAAIERRRFEDQIDSLRALLEQARRNNNADAEADINEAIRKAQELHEIRMAAIRAEQAAREQADAAEFANQNATIIQQGEAAKAQQEGISQGVAHERDLRQLMAEETEREELGLHDRRLRRIDEIAKKQRQSIRDLAEGARLDAPPGVILVQVPDVRSIGRALEQQGRRSR